MSELMIEVHDRTELGKNANRRARKNGLIPGVVYGGGRDTVSIQVDRRKALEILRQGAGENTVFLLKRAGTDQSRHAMIHDMDVDPRTRQILHIDFLRVLMDEKVRVQVPVELVGLSTGVKNEGGILDFVTREVELECLPNDIPDSVSIDVSGLHVGQHLEVHQLVLPDGVALIEDPDKVLVSIGRPKVATETDDDDDGDLLATPAQEPELIKKTKEE